MSTTTTLKVSLAFVNLSDDPLVTYGTNVSDLLYVCPAYPDPPLTAAELNLIITAFGSAKAAQPSGGKAGTALKNEKRAALLVALRKIAAYVQEECGNSLATLLLSGFDAISTTRTRAELAKPVIKTIAPGSGGARVTVGAIRNTRTYEVRVALVDADGITGPYVTVASVPSSRGIPLAGLIPGGLYLFQVRAIGGLTGSSEWSEALMQRVL